MPIISWLTQIEANSARLENEIHFIIFKHVLLMQPSFGNYYLEIEEAVYICPICSIGNCSRTEKQSIRNMAPHDLRFFFQRNRYSSRRIIATVAYAKAFFTVFARVFWAIFIQPYTFILSYINGYLKGNLHFELDAKQERR